jgi:hypothetical protein
MQLRTHAPLFAGLVAMLACFMPSGDAHAQYHHPAYRPHSRAPAPHARSLYVGGGLAATRILQQEGGNELLEGGGGLSLFAGLRLNRTLALEAGWTATLHNPVAVDTSFGEDTDYLVLNGFTVDAKVFLGASDPRMQPFLQAGVGMYLLDSEYFGAQSVGTGFQAGGGLEYQIGPSVGIGARALYRGLAMGPPQADYNDTFVSALTIEGNLSVRF